MQADTTFHRSPVEAGLRLAGMRLDLNRLLSAGAVALSARRRASALHPANAPGTFSYHDGVEAIRVEFMGRDGWARYAVGGLEGIYNEETQTIILFRNVDRCCDEHKTPQVGKIGANSKRICAAPLFEKFGMDLPEVVYTLLPTSTHVKTSKFAVYYLMLDPEGGLELSRPVIEDDAITHCIERIFLQDGRELALDDVLPEKGPMDGDDFVIEVKRKNEQ